MPSSATARLRLNKQFTGENINTWGVLLNAVLDLIDSAAAGFTTMALSGPVTLTSNNFIADQARQLVLNFTGGTGGVVTIPGVEKAYVVRNGTTGGVTIETGAGTTATVLSGDVEWVICDGTNVFLVEEIIGNRNDARAAKLTNLAYPTLDTDAATMRYVLDQAFGSIGGNFPGQPGNQNRFLMTDGANAAWADPLPSMVAKSGLILSNNGTDRTGASWIKRLPDQSGATIGKSLRSNGTAQTGDLWDFVGGLLAKAGDYTPAALDVGSLIAFTGSHTCTLPAAATYGAKYGVTVQNAGTGNLTYARTGADTLDGLTGYIGYPGEVRLWSSDGVSAWTSIVLKAFNVAWLAGLTLQWPPGYTSFDGFGWGGGGSGASGAASGNNGGGGGGGACSPYSIPASAIVAGATATVTIAAGGASVVGTATGNNGGNSSIGALRTFYGGGGGDGGGGGGVLSAGAGSTPGAPIGPISTVAVANQGLGGGYAGTTPGADGAPSGFGGGAGALGVTNATGKVGGASLYGGGGGGMAGSTTGGAGGVSVQGGSGGAGGTTNAAPGIVGAVPGGGGGGAHLSQNSGAGGAGKITMRGVV